MKIWYSWFFCHSYNSYSPNILTWLVDSELNTQWGYSNTRPCVSDYRAHLMQQVSSRSIPHKDSCFIFVLSISIRRYEIRNTSLLKSSFSVCLWNWCAFALNKQTEDTKSVHFHWNPVVAYIYLSFLIKIFKHNMCYLCAKWNIYTRKYTTGF